MSSTNSSGGGHQQMTSLRASSPHQLGGEGRRGGGSASSESLLASAGTSAGSFSGACRGSSNSVGDVMEQMKLYIQQVLMLCQTMLAVVETNTRQNQTETVSPMDESSPGTGSDQQNQVNFLKAKLKELVGMNVGWQTAHTHQEQRIAELEEQNSQLLLQLQNRSVTGAAAGWTEQQQEDIDRLLLEQRHKYMALEENCRQVVQENNEIKKQLAHYKDHVQVLEMQSKVYQEDFENERTDRERAQSRLAELELELQKYRSKQVVVGSTMPYGDTKSQFCASASNATRSLWHNQLQQQYQRPMMTTGYYQTDASDGGDVHLDGTVEVDCVPRGGGIVNETTGRDVTDSVPLADDVRRFHIGLDVSEKADLKCPKCRKEFTEDEHIAFMDHLDLCVDTI